MRWHSLIPPGIWPWAEIQIKRFHTQGQKLKMRKVPLGWAGENVSTPHLQPEVILAFMNKCGLFPFIPCVISTEGPSVRHSMKQPHHLHTELLWMPQINWEGDDGDILTTFHREQKPLDRSGLQTGQRESETWSSVPTRKDLRRITISLGHSDLIWKILPTTQVIGIVGVHKEPPQDLLDLPE